VDLGPGLAVALDMQIGMVLLSFCQRRDRVEQFHGRPKVWQVEVAADPQTVVGDPPGRQGSEQPLGFLGGEPWHAPLTGNAFFGRQFGGDGITHGLKL